MEDSVFTKIIKGEIPCYKIYEDDTVFSMLDINPLSDGHVLVFPKEQVDLIWNLNDETYQKLWATAKKIAKCMQEELQPLRVGIVVEGLSVPHAHIHLVPLYDGDVLQLHHGYPVDKSEENLKALQQRISNRVSAEL